MVFSSIRKGRVREGKTYRNQVANLSAFREQRRWGKKTFATKMLYLTSLNYAHVCYLNVENGEMAAE